MSASSIKFTNLQQGLENGTIHVSLKNGRHFILKNGKGASLTMKKITHRLAKQGQNSPSLVARSIVLELQGQAKLEHASSWKRFRVRMRQIFGNRSFNQDLHLQKLNAFTPPVTLTQEQIKLKQDLITQLGEFEKSAEYDKYKGKAAYEFALGLAEMRPGPKEEICKEIKKNLDKYIDAECDDESVKLIANIFAKFEKNENAIIEILNQVSESHPWMVIGTMAEAEGPTMQNKLAFLARMENLQPLLRQIFKDIQYY